MPLYSNIVSGADSTATADAIVYVNKTILDVYGCNKRNIVEFLKKIGEDKILNTHLSHLASVKSEETCWTLHNFHISYGVLYKR